jgi:hypothetical protein
VRRGDEWKADYSVYSFALIQDKYCGFDGPV